MNAHSHITSAKTTVSAAFAFGLLAALLTPVSQASAQDRHAEAAKSASYVLSGSLPTPIHIVMPRVGKEYAGTRLNMTFWVSKSGRASTFGLPDNRVDPNLVRHLEVVLGFWQFEPARDENGNPVARKVILPVSIQAPKDGAEARVAFGRLTK